MTRLVLGLLGVVGIGLAIVAFRRANRFDEPSLMRDMRALWGTTVTARIRYAEPDRAKVETTWIREWSSSRVGREGRQNRKVA